MKATITKTGKRIEAKVRRNPPQLVRFRGMCPERVWLRPGDQIVVKRESNYLVYLNIA